MTTENIKDISSRHGPMTIALGYPRQASAEPARFLAQPTGSPHGPATLPAFFTSRDT
jgi:hypothetical protein